jgi:hypothetical protein
MMAVPRSLWFMLYVSESFSTGIRATFGCGRAEIRVPKPQASPYVKNEFYWTSLLTVAWLVKVGTFVRLFK